MHNVLIFGSGRSGTSMLAGMLRNSGYYQGDHYIQPREANPNGFFEDREVNRINDEAIAAHLYRSSLRKVMRRIGAGLPKMSHWLASLPGPLDSSLAAQFRPRIIERLSRRPFCFKDPRFCYTLPIWKSALPEDTRGLVVFRHPARTARSIMREVAESRKLARVKMTFRRACDIWSAHYRSALELAYNGAPLLFVQYDHLLDGAAVETIEEFVHAKLDRSFAQRNLSRTTVQSTEPVSTDVMAVYDQLRHYSGSRETSSCMSV